jgi:hypothetical protein
MVSHPSSSSDRQGNNRAGAGNAHGKAEKTPGTPRKEGGPVKDRAIQDAGLKDYVRLLVALLGSGMLLMCGLDSWRMPGKGSFWLCIQGV